MEKPEYNSKGTRQLVNSGWKAFDRQTNCISTGNVYANTQYSGCIRPWKETECNGRQNPEGHLTEFDLKPFRNLRIPKRIENILKDKNRTESMILYMFFILDKYNHVKPFYWAVTDYGYKLVDDVIVLHVHERYEKRLAAKNEILKYITAAKS